MAIANREDIHASANLDFACGANLDINSIDVAALVTATVFVGVIGRGVHFP